MADGDGRLTWLREPARFLGIFALFVVIEELRGGDGTDSDFPVLLAELLIAVAIVDLVVRAWRTVAGRGSKDRGRPVALTPALLVVLVGLPVLVGSLILGARLSSDDWASATERAVTSPYSWIMVVVYLTYALTWTPIERREHRRWPALRAAENLASGLLSIGAIGAIGAIGSEVLPDRWYGTLGGIVLAVVGATGSANLAQQVFGHPTGPEASATTAESSTGRAGPTA